MMSSSPRTPGSATALCIVIGACVVLALVGASCSARAPDAVAGAAAGSACGDSLACDDGLVCACGVCAAPGDASSLTTCTQEPPTPVPLCGDEPVECVDSCESNVVLELSSCIDGEDVCAVGVPVTTCRCPAVVPGGWYCAGTTLACISPASTGGCIVGCTTPAFDCTAACPVTSTFPSLCVEQSPGGGAERICDATGSVPVSVCPSSEGEGEGEGVVVAEGEGEGVVVAEGEGEGATSTCSHEPCTCGGVDRVLCLRNCDPNDAPLDFAQCVASSWSCAGFSGYTAANACPGGGP